MSKKCTHRMELGQQDFTGTPAYSISYCDKCNIKKFTFYDCDGEVNSQVIELREKFRKK